jgi:hypothetical protein
VKVIKRGFLGRLTPDTLKLLISNLMVIVLALVQGGDITPILWVYWWQSVIIGFFSWRRMKKLKQFSAEGLKINGRRVQATEKTRKWMAASFIFHFGAFHLFYLFFLLSIPEEVPEQVILSVAVGITIFLFNHFFSYRINLGKDLLSKPDIAALAFFPYARVIPMHLVIFIGFEVGRGSKIELLLFLLLKTVVDLSMHVVQHVVWNKPKRSKFPLR